MQTNEIIDSLEKTLNGLKDLENELYRPKEDVVTLSVCFSVRQSMMDMLRLYLIGKSVKHDEDTNLNDLLLHCQAIDDQCANIDFSGIKCKDELNASCSGDCYISPEKVTDCVVIANQLKLLIVDKLKVE